MTCFNAASKYSPDADRIALFGPQVTKWTLKGLSNLQSALLEDTKFDFLRQALAELPSLWSLLQKDCGLNGFSGLGKLEKLRDFAQGERNLDPHDLTNTELSSLTVVSQVISFIRLNDTAGTNDGILGFEAAQGFCVGFLSAAALASANNWAECEYNVSNAVRLAACIGIIVDAEKLSHPVHERPTAIHVRWKTPEDRAFIEICLDSFPGVRDCLSFASIIHLRLRAGQKLHDESELGEGRGGKGTLNLGRATLIALPWSIDHS